MSNYTEQVERYSILIEGGPSSNYFAWSPELPGLRDYWRVRRRSRAGDTGSNRVHLEGLAEDGGPIPEPSGLGGYVERNRAQLRSGELGTAFRPVTRSRGSQRKGGLSAAFPKVPANLDGARRTRTADLLGAIQALSQLSYSPGRPKV